VPKIKKEKAINNGWSRWIPPSPKRYKTMCCDCGLVHDIEFKVIKIIKELPSGLREKEDVDNKNIRVMFRVKRNNRSTGQARRKNFEKT
jgi:hypothetical protein